MGGGAAVDRGAASGLCFLGHMRRDAREAQIGDEFPCIVALVRYQRLLVSARQSQRYSHGCLPFPIAVHRRGLTGEQPSVAVHEAVAQIAEVDTGTTGLAEQPCIPIPSSAVRSCWPCILIVAVASFSRSLLGLTAAPLAELAVGTCGFVASRFT